MKKTLDSVFFTPVPVSRASRHLTEAGKGERTMANIIPADKIEAVTGICLDSGCLDAVELAGILMADPAIRMHGPEHHFLVAAALLTAYSNSYCPELKYSFLKKAAQRTGRIPVAVCALYGTCGAMMGAGAAVSIMTRANPFAADPLQLVNRVTAAIQQELAGYAGIRCCKRSVWASLRGTQQVLAGCEGLALPLPERGIRCPWCFSHDACIGGSCPYCQED